MKALTLPAGRGWHWLSGGFRLFRKGRLVLSLAVLGYWLCMALINSFPIVGQIAASLLVPAFSVGLMNVCRLIEQGGTLQARELFSGLRQNQRTLLVLGAIYIVAGVCVLGFVSLIDGGVLFQAIVLGDRLDERTLSSGEFVLAVQVALLLFSPIMAWFPRRQVAVLQLFCLCTKLARICCLCRGGHTIWRASTGFTRRFACFSDPRRKRTVLCAVADAHHAHFSAYALR